jgi:hypothetical protein
MVTTAIEKVAPQAQNNLRAAGAKQLVRRVSYLVKLNLAQTIQSSR